MSKKKRERQRKGTFAGSQDWKKFTQQAASAKIKVKADEKLHRRVRGNDTCMIMRSSQEPSYMIPMTRMARNGTSSFELDEIHQPKKTIIRKVQKDWIKMLKRTTAVRKIVRDWMKSLNRRQRLLEMKTLDWREIRNS